MTEKTISFEKVGVADGQVINLDGTVFRKLTWSDISAVSKDWGAFNGYGDNNGYFNTARTTSVVGATNEVSPGVSDSFLTSPGATFKIHSGLFSAVWQTEDVTFTAYRDGVVVGHRTVTLGITPEKIVFGHHFADIDSFEISAVGPGGDNSNVAMDRLHFEIDDSSSAPVHQDAVAEAHAIFANLQAHAAGGDWVV